MKKIFTVVLALYSLSAWAHDFKVDGIYYDYLEGKNVEVTYKGISSSEYSNEYSDAVTIPETVTYDGTTYSVTSIGNEAFYDCTSLTSITIPNSVTSIGFGAFYGCTSLTSITIPNSVTSIGDYAFSNCYGLTIITIPSSVTSIGERPFSGTGIYNDESNWENSVLYIDNCLIGAKESISGSYTIKENTRLIADHAFSSCFSLTSVTIGNSVTNIGRRTFSACYSLMSVIVESGNTIYDSRENCNAIIETASNTLIAGCQNTIIPNNVISIGVQAFCGCSFTSVTIPNSVTSIGDGAFNWCGSLTSVTIPNSVTSIGEQAFCGCSFTSVTIPNSVTSIGIHAFAECTSLDSVTCLAMTPPAMEENVFSGCDNPTLFVPCQALLDYQVHEQWGQLTTIECISSEEAETEEVIIESGTTTVTITWPTEDNADTYAIVIEKDDEIFCTLTFNADGQLLNIAFAPARNGNSHGAQSAAQTAKGLRFTVIGLEEATTYAYNIIAKDATDKTINSYLGEFTTKGGTTTDMDNIQSPVTTCQKVMRNGQLIILRDGKTYTAMGAEM